MEVRISIIAILLIAQSVPNAAAEPLTTEVPQPQKIDSFEDVRLRRLGLSCGTVASVRYCFPQRLLYGDYAPTEDEVAREPEYLKIDPKHFDLIVPYNATLAPDCYDKVIHEQLEFSLSAVQADDSLDAYARRDFERTRNELDKPLRSASWAGLKCAKSSNFPEGTWCLSETAIPAQGGMIIQCNRPGSVPVPHCSQRYYHDGLVITTHNLRNCGIHWREIRDVVDNLLIDGRATAAKIDDDEL